MSKLKIEVSKRFGRGGYRICTMCASTGAGAGIFIGTLTYFFWKGFITQ